jgi:hypothetical protein
MALNAKTAVLRRNAMIDNFCANADTQGYLRIYDGTQPTDADTNIGAQVLLAELRFSLVAFGAASAGSAAANAITSGTGLAASTATWFRVFKADGTTVMCDGSVGLSACNLNLNAVVVAIGATVSVSAFTVTQAA